MTVAVEQTRPTTIVVDETDGVGSDGDGVTVDAPRWAALATDVLLAEGVTHGELGLLFVGPERMASLNLEHMGFVGPTDVLAFPLDGAATIPATETATATILIGDVVICPEQARAQAPLHQSRCHDGSFEDVQGSPEGAPTHQSQSPKCDPADVQGSPEGAPTHQSQSPKCDPADVQGSLHGAVTLQSRCHDGSLEDELALLVVHGVLHVLGYDHVNDTEAALMHAREQQLLSAHHRQP